MDKNQLVFESEENVPQHLIENIANPNLAAQREHRDFNYSQVEVLVERFLHRRDGMYHSPSQTALLEIMYKIAEDATAITSDLRLRQCFDF